MAVTLSYTTFEDRHPDINLRSRISKGVVRAIGAAFSLFATSYSLVAQSHHPLPPFPPRPHTPQSIVLLFAGQSADGHVSLILNNNRQGEMAAKLTVFTENGEHVSLPDIEMVPQESKQLDLDPLLTSAGLGARPLGWLKVEYSGMVMELGAQLTLYPINGGDGVDSPRTLDVDYKSTERDAVFWLPKGGKARIALTNESTESITVALKCGSFVERVVVSSDQTILRQVDEPPARPFSRDEAGSATSCDLRSNGAASALRVAGIVVAGSFSSPIRFYDPKVATFKSLTVVAVETSAQTFVTAHNVTDLPVIVTPVVREAALHSPITEALDPLMVPPGGSIPIPLDAALKHFIDHQVSQVTLTLRTDAPKGALVGAVTQITKQNGLIEDIPLRTSNPPAYARGSYPLRWDSDYTNLVSVTNTSEETLQFGGQITAAGMTYVLAHVDIEPGATHVVDVDKMKRERIGDVWGHLIPEAAQFGKLHWVELAHGTKAGLLGRQSLTSVLNRRKSSFSCGSTCQYEFFQSPYFFPDIATSVGPFTVGSSQTSAITKWVNNTNGTTDYYLVGYRDGIAHVDDSSIISIGPDPQSYDYRNSNYNGILLSGESLGVAEISYSYDWGWYDMNPDLDQCNLIDSGTTDVGGTIEVGTKIELFFVDCRDTATTGFIIGGWGIPGSGSCNLSAHVPPPPSTLPLGGTCGPNSQGTNNVYQYPAANGKTTTVSLDLKRTVDANCLNFVDSKSGIISVTM